MTSTQEKFCQALKSFDFPEEIMNFFVENEITKNFLRKEVDDIQALIKKSYEILGLDKE